MALPLALVLGLALLQLADAVVGRNSGFKGFKQGSHMQKLVDLHSHPFLWMFLGLVALLGIYNCYRMVIKQAKRNLQMRGSMQMTDEEFNARLRHRNAEMRERMAQQDIRQGLGMER